MLKALSRKMMTSEWGVERMLGGGVEVGRRRRRLREMKSPGRGTN